MDMGKLKKLHKAQRTVHVCFKKFVLDFTKAHSPKCLFHKMCC